MRRCWKWKARIWRFAHSKLHDGVLRDLSDEERRDLHRRVAGAIEKLYEYSSRTAASLAYHWRNVGDNAKEEHTQRWLANRRYAAAHMMRRRRF